MDKKLLVMSVKVPAVLIAALAVAALQQCQQQPLRQHLW
jgi:hypothetical protein